MKKFKTGGISICFHCQKQLVRIKGGFIFALIADPLGNQIRVHKDCVRHAIGEGYKEVKA
jgi:hypothetical protein